MFRLREQKEWILISHSGRMVQFIRSPFNWWWCGFIDHNTNYIFIWILFLSCHEWLTQRNFAQDSLKNKQHSILATDWESEREWEKEKKSTRLNCEEKNCLNGNSNKSVVVLLIILCLSFSYFAMIYNEWIEWIESWYRMRFIAYSSL